MTQLTGEAIEKGYGASAGVPAHVDWAQTLLPVARHLAACDSADRAVAAMHCVLLVPFAQLIEEARRHWPQALSAAQLPAETLMPRVETTRSWQSSLAPEALDETDYSGSAARDWLRARSLLAASAPDAMHSAGASAMVQALCSAARELLPLALAQAPEQRQAWGDRLRQHLPKPGSEFSEALRWESQVSQIALAWLGLSRFESDALWRAAGGGDVQRVFSLPGLEESALEAGLAERWGGVWRMLPWVAFSRPEQTLQVFACADAHDEAQRAAALVLRQLSIGAKTHVALVAQDRQLVRRILAMIDAHPDAPELRLRDETGWRLSTTRAAAQLMAWLRAAQPRASADAVLDALKAMELPLGPLELRLRQAGFARWAEAQPGVRAWLSSGDSSDAGPKKLLGDALDSMALLQRRLAQSQYLQDAVQALGESLTSAPAWQPEADVAQQACVQALALHDHARWQAELGSADEFNAWVSAVLEAESFQPPQFASPRPVPTLTVVPMAQCIAREFSALVFAGAGEDSLALPAAAVGWWTAAQRTALGLPSREARLAQAKRALAIACAQPGAHVLWRRSERGEARLASVLLQAQCLAQAWVPGADPLQLERHLPTQTQQPGPAAESLTLSSLSASAYRDWRTCPYRFFAQHLLRLREPDELDASLDARDWGKWIHRVMQRFHEREDRLDAGWLDECAEAARREEHIDAADFVPFAAAWGSVRGPLLHWLFDPENATKTVALEQTNTRAEGPYEQKIVLKGTLDRLAAAPPGLRLLDYKTDSGKTADRLRKAPMADVQLPFYALLLQDAYEEPLREGGYLSFAEGRRAAVWFSAHPDLGQGRDRLRDAINSDVADLRSGGAMVASGQGDACRHCASRGLCRKDHWPSFDADAEANAPEAPSDGEPA